MSKQFILLVIFVFCSGQSVEAKVKQKATSGEVKQFPLGAMTAAVPQGIYYLPEEQAANLQTALIKYKKVRLKPQGDYRHLKQIYLKSGDQLYGLGRTKTPEITIKPGSKNIFVSDIDCKFLWFPGSGRVTKENHFNRMDASIGVLNAKLENNLFTDINGRIKIDTRQSGYIKNNRFIRVKTHGSSPSISIMGDSKKNSSGNIFIWGNVLTPHGDGIIVKNQKNIFFVGIDAESWNWSRRAKYPGMMNVSNTNYLSVFMPNGGDPKANDGRYFNLDAENILLQGMAITRTKNPGLNLGTHVQGYIGINTRDIGLEFDKNKTEMVEFGSIGKPFILLNRRKSTVKKFNASTTGKMQKIVEMDQELFKNWEKPVFPDVTASDFPEGNKKNSRQKDSAESIQSLIDKNGIAMLEAGNYYISKPLRLKKSQGIVGAGESKTKIIAMSKDIDMIVGDDHLDEKIMTLSITLADLTIQGGRNGLNLSKEGSGNLADYHHITLSQLTIREMQNAGILIKEIYAWDNNFIDHVNFYDCPSGIMQRPKSEGAVENKGMTFLDKNVFYRCQFERCKIAIDWQARRANNLNAFIDCRFRNNEQVIVQRNSNSTFFANSLLIENHGKPMIQSNSPIGFIHSDFISESLEDVHLSHNLICNACNFISSGSNAKGIEMKNLKRVYFTNCTFNRLLASKMDQGVLFHCLFSKKGKPGEEKRELISIQS